MLASKEQTATDNVCLEEINRNASATSAQVYGNVDMPIQQAGDNWATRPT